MHVEARVYSVQYIVYVCGVRVCVSLTDGVVWNWPTTNDGTNERACDCATCVPHVLHIRNKRHWNKSQYAYVI